MPPRGLFTCAASPASSTRPTRNVDATRWYGGFVLGFRVGFRHVHAALELDGAFHHVRGELAGMKATLEQFTLTPGGALTFSF